MLNSHNSIRFIIIDHGFTRKTVYKHSISNNNVPVPVHLKLTCHDKLWRNDRKKKKYKLGRHISFSLFEFTAISNRV